MDTKTAVNTIETLINLSLAGGIFKYHAEVDATRQALICLNDLVAENEALKAKVVELETPAA